MNLDFDDDDESVYETFSDTIFCVCVVLLALVAMLALNINEQLSYFKIEPIFYGGAQRPHLYLNLYPYENSKLDLTDTNLDTLFADNRKLYKVGLFSPTAALTSTKKNDSKMISSQQGESYDSISSLTLSGFLDLVAGIDPGVLEIFDESSPFLLPIDLKKNLLYPPNTILEPAPRSQFKQLLQLAWPIYEKPVFPIRSFRDFKDAKVRVYIETLEQEEHRFLVIGHYILPIEDVESGFLDFIISLSSSYTEIVYLGKYWEDPKNFTNRRIEFFEKNGLNETAQAFKVHDYHWNEHIDGFEQKFKDHPKWKDLAKTQDKETLKNKVIAMINEMKIAQFIEGGGNLTQIQILLPPIIQYPDFWKQYIAACLDKPEFPPEWFLKLFLQKLGYNHFAMKVPEPQ